MKIRTHPATLTLAALAAVALLSAGMTAGAQSLKRGKFVHSFPPTPLFRGVTDSNKSMGSAEFLVNSRLFSDVPNDEAAFEVAVDVAALEPDTGNVIADFCVRRTVAMHNPLDLKRIVLTVTETGVQFRWPDGTVTDAALFESGSNVEVAILAFAVRGDGSKLATLEKASMRVSGDLDDDGTQEFRAFMGSDLSKTRFTS